MKDINFCTFTGRLTKDAELKTLQSGTAITRFTVANNYSKKNGEEWEEKANFFDCVIIGKFGESMKPYLVKGIQITVAGEIRQQTWEDDKGDRKSKIEFIVSDINLKSEKKSNNPPGSNYDTKADKPEETKPSEVEKAIQQEFNGGPETFEDVPF